jgi:hypothetical protein
MFNVYFFTRIVLLALLVVLSSCGGGSSDDTSSTGDVIDDPDTQINDNPNTGGAASLSRPTISTSQMEDSIVVAWNQSNASHYRVLYWEGSEAPQEYVTSDLEHTSPPVTAGSEYTVIVEAYDELGNSLFSEPSTLEVL